MLVHPCTQNLSKLIQKSYIGQTDIFAWVGVLRELLLRRDSSFNQVLEGHYFWDARVLDNLVTKKFVYVLFVYAESG